MVDREKINEYAKSLVGKTKEELEKMETDLIQESEDNQKRVNALEFTLPTKDKKEAFAAIREFLNKQSYQWSYTLGAKAMYDFWEPTAKTVTYPVLDATLRTLGELQFKGIDEWNSVIKINNYFAPLRDDYVAATDSIYEIADKHSAIINQLKMFDEVQPINE